MRKLDRNAAFGRVTPPEVMAECDRPAHYAQNDRYFDQHDREIVPGQPLKVQVVPEVGQESDRTAEATPISPVQLLAQSGSMPWARFIKEAKRILGPSCPAGKQAVVEALKAAVAGYQQRVEKRIPAAAPGQAASAPPCGNAR